MDEYKKNNSGLADMFGERLSVVDVAKWKIDQVFPNCRDKELECYLVLSKELVCGDNYGRKSVQVFSPPLSHFSI